MIGWAKRLPTKPLSRTATGWMTTRSKTSGSTRPRDASNVSLVEMRTHAIRQHRGLRTLSNSTIERFEARLSRAEARAARAFESVAEILERSNAARDGDRQALIDAVRRLEAINGCLSGVAQTAEGAASKPRLDLKAAVSQIAMRRAELDDSLVRGTPGHDTAARMQSPHADE